MRDKLSNYSPEDLVYDIDDRSKHAPWEANISPVVTSCANFYTTADGKDLLFDIVSQYDRRYGTKSPKLALFASSLTLTLTLARATLDMLGAERSRTI